MGEQPQANDRPGTGAATPLPAAAAPRQSGGLRDDPLGFSDIRSDVADGWQEEPFRSGFTPRVVAGALFIALVMMPGLIYMGLMVGTNIGSGAEWVTVLLFLEIARRSFRKLLRQELIIIHHMAATLTGAIGGIVLAGGVFADLIWKQYLKQSDAYRHFNLTDQMPRWFAPGAEALKDRTFLNEAWLPAMAVALAALVLYRMQFFGIGYLVFRLTSDVERLPFPLAQIGAEGATALAESDRRDEGSWRWNVFSLLGVIGVVWGLVYMGIPTLSATLFGTRVALIPIPFLDLTPYTQAFLPSAALAIGFDLGLIVLAFVIPWRVVVGTAAASVLCQLVLPPFLYRWGIHRQWQYGFGALDTQIANSLDLWLSVGIGGALSVALTGFWLALRAARRARQGDPAAPRGYDWSRLWNPPPGRGDFPAWLSIAFFLAAGAGFVLLVHGIVNLGWLGGHAKPPAERFPLWILCAFAFLWTPVNTYIHARLIGIAGQNVAIPFVREGSIFLSGYRHPDIWVAPLPVNDFGGVANLFKQLELVRVRFTSLFKVELLSVIVLTIAGFVYWSYLWSLGSIPSENYPFASQMWPFYAKNQALWASALGEGNRMMQDALSWKVIGGSCAAFCGLFAALSVAGLPLAYYFGAVGGVGQFPYIALTLLAGLGVRLLVARKLGPDNLKRYAPVMMAGFSAGFGIAGMLVVAIVLVKSAMSALAY
jgi:uncharacterized membrane protein